MMSSSHTLPKYLSSTSTYEWMTSSAMSSLSSLSTQATKKSDAYLRRQRRARIPARASARGRRRRRPAHRLYTSLCSLYSMKLHSLLARLSTMAETSRRMRAFSLLAVVLYHLDSRTLP